MKKIMPTSLLLIAMLLVPALHFIYPGMTIIPRGWNLLGLLPVLAGAAINLAADRAFHRAGTTVKPFQESSHLITDGVFGWTRNPMYLGFVLILAGMALLLRTLSPWLVVLGYAILVDLVYIRVEEGMLAQTFGGAWEDYRRRTRRWV